MERYTKSIFLHFVALIICFLLFFDLNDCWINSVYLYSLMVGMWIVFLTAWQSIFNEILINNISKKKNVLISIIEIIVNAAIIIGGYYLIIYLHNKYLPNEIRWVNLTYSYKSTDIKESAKEFLNYAYMVKILNIPVVALAITNGIINIYVTIISKIAEKLKNSLFLEKILKLYFVCSPIFTIIIALCFTPKTYAFILIALPVFICLALAIVITYIVLLNRAFKDFKKDNKNKNLIIVETLYNYDFNVMTNFDNIMGKFLNDRKLKLAINTNNALIVSNDIVRNNLIDVSKYKNVSYFIYYNFKAKKVISIHNKKLVDKFLAHIEDLEKQKAKLVVMANVEGIDENTIEEISKVCKNDLYVGIEASQCLEELLKKKDNNELKNTVEEMTKFLKNKNFDKNEFTKYIYDELNELNTSNPIKSFYTLMKINEYIIHYRALVNICKNKKKKYSEYLLKNSMANWDRAQEDIGIEISNKDVVKKSCDNILNLLYYKSPVIESKKIEIKEINYKNLCSMLITIRNRTIGHGNITYDISSEIVSDLAVITQALLICFIEKFEKLKENDNFNSILTNEGITAYKKLNELMYLYNYGREFKDKKTGKINKAIYEYLDYKTGKIICEKDKAPYRLNIRDDDKEMEL